MTNNNITTTAFNAAVEVINRQLEGCYRLIAADRKVIKSLAFVGTAEAEETIADAKAAILSQEGRIKGLIFARDEFILRFHTR